MVYRPEREGHHRAAYEKNKKIVFATQNTCGICGKPVDFSLKAPDPMSAVIDHIIPIAKGGHPSDIENLQLAHWSCNRAKSDKVFFDHSNAKMSAQIGNRNLPQSKDWKKYSNNA